MLKPSKTLKLAKFEKYHAFRFGFNKSRIRRHGVAHAFAESFRNFHTEESFEFKLFGSCARIAYDVFLASLFTYVRPNTRNLVIFITFLNTFTWYAPSLNTLAEFLIRPWGLPYYCVLFKLPLSAAVRIFENFFLSNFLSIFYTYFLCCFFFSRANYFSSNKYSNFQRCSRLWKYLFFYFYSYLGTRMIVFSQLSQKKN